MIFVAASRRIGEADHFLVRDLIEVDPGPSRSNRDRRPATLILVPGLSQLPAPVLSLLAYFLAGFSGES